MIKISKAAIYSAIVLTLLFSAVNVFAHEGEKAINPMEETMRQMMGDSAFGAMEQMEEQMMGRAAHERMEELMNKMFAGNLTPSEQDEMTQMMKDSESGAGAMNMMTRGMMGQSFLNSRERTAPSMMGWTGVASWTYWVTMALIWFLLALVIVAIFIWLLRRKK